VSARVPKHKIDSRKVPSGSSRREAVLFAAIVIVVASLPFASGPENGIDQMAQLLNDGVQAAWKALRLHP
jgi:hypothetical protein